MGNGKYRRLDAVSPFHNSPVFYSDVTGSTMNDIEQLLSNGTLPGTLKNAIDMRSSSLPGSGSGGPVPASVQSGTILSTGYQTAGIGRLPGRKWETERGENALFSLLLHKDDTGFPFGLFPLLAGLGYCCYLETEFGLVPKIKWPNDILLLHEGVYKKSAGILCRKRGDWYVLGTGINCNQTAFTGDLAERAVSVGMCTNRVLDPTSVFLSVVGHCRELFEAASADTKPAYDAQNKGGHKSQEQRRFDYKNAIESRLLYMGEEVTIAAGCSPEDVRFPVVIQGIDDDGALLYIRKGAAIPESLYAGEISLAKG